MIYRTSQENSPSTRTLLPSRSFASALGGRTGSGLGFGGFLTISCFFDGVGHGSWGSGGSGGSLASGSLSGLNKGVTEHGIDSIGS